MSRKAWVAFVLVQLFGDLGPLGWASHEVGSWACPVVRRNHHHDAWATGIPVADGEGSVGRPSDHAGVQCRVHRDRDRRQRVLLAAVRPRDPFPSA